MIVINSKVTNSKKYKYIFIINNDDYIFEKSVHFNNLNDFYNYIKKISFKKTDNILLISDNNIDDYYNILNFIIYYQEEKKLIENELLKFNKHIKKDDNKIINESLDYFKGANQNGKCIRGMLIDLGYKLHNNDNYALKLAASYEAFETSILIHDDIIDNSDLRRGKTTIHELYKKDFKNYNIDNTPYNLALCIGDIGFYYVNDYLVNNYKKDKNLIKLLCYYNKVVIDTIKGEIVDVYLPFIEKNDKNHKLYEEDILKIYKLKTSKYTIVGPFVLGMILSGSTDKEIEKFEHILEPIGISFQIKDDILGIMSSNKTIGKSVYSDIEEFKQTILYSYIKLNKKEYYNKLLKYYGKKINEADFNKVQDIIRESGALEYANNKMNELFNTSKKNIKELRINNNIKSILLGLIIFLELRNK